VGADPDGGGVIAVVDGNNLLIRGMKALGDRNQMTSHGVPTGTLLLFIKTLARFVKEIEPERLVVVWDAGHEFRTKIWDGYKAGRAERSFEDHPEDPFEQAKEFLSAAGIHHVSMPGVEADDLVAHYWRHRPMAASLHLVSMIIVSGDRDMFQLLDPDVEQWRPMPKGVIDKWDYGRVYDELGVDPKYLSMVRALTGDASDGIDGIPGIGPKTAAKIVDQCKLAWGGVLEHPKVAPYCDLVERNLKLIDLRDTDVGCVFPTPPLFKPVRAQEPDGEMLERFFERYEMKSIRTSWMLETLWQEAA
jgi:DNA polymerase-1